MMKMLLSASTVIAVLGAGSAMANSVSGAYSSAVDKVLGGHGEVGEIARSASNPDVSYEVKVGGLIEKKNSRFATVETVTPNWPVRPDRPERR